MIDWFNVFANSLWIFALAITLATVSFARWETNARGVKVRDLMKTLSWHKKLTSAGLLFCLGIGLTSLSWASIIWFVLSLLFMAQYIHKKVTSHDH